MQTRDGFSKLPKQVMLNGLFFLIMMIFAVAIYADFGDDLVYARAWVEQPLGVFLRDRYDWWSSRVVIEAVMLPLIGMSPYLWYILNTVMILILIWITADLFGADDKTQAQLIFFALIWLVPLDTINGAGWIVTTLNYLWPLALGLVAMRPLKHWLRDEKCARWEYIVCPLCVLYASNAEQMGAILLGVYLLCGIWFVVKKKHLTFFYIIQMVLIVISLYFILCAPGNKNRYNYEMERYFPEFEELGVGSKLLMGFLENAHYYIAGGHDRSCFLFACMAGVLFLCFLSGKFHEKDSSFSGASFIGGNQKNILTKSLMFMVAICPLTAYWMCAYFFPFLIYTVNVPRARNLLWCLSENRNLPMQSICPDYIIVIQMIFYLVVIICVALTIYFLHGRSYETLLELLVLGAGFASRMIMGFSPTIYMSGSRTAIFCSMAVLIVILRNIQLWMGKGQKTVWKIVMGIYVSGCILCNIV